MKESYKIQVHQQLRNAIKSGQNPNQLRIRTCKSTPRLNHTSRNTHTASTRNLNTQTNDNNNNFKTQQSNQLKIGNAFENQLTEAEFQFEKMLKDEIEGGQIDFNLMKKIHEQCQNEDQTSSQYKVMNPCYLHPKRSIKFICREEQLGLCQECMVEHFKQDHRMISIDDQLKQVQTVLLNLEQNLQEILKSKNNILKKFEAQIEFLNKSKKDFLADQKKKIEELKKYLDDRYLHIVCQYNLAYDRDLVFNKNKIEKVSDKIQENIMFIQKIQQLREEFISLDSDVVTKDKQRTIEGRVIKNFVKTGKFLDYYNSIKEKELTKKEKDAKAVFPTHAQNSVKYLSIDIEKEIKILTKKFKDLNFKQEQVQQLVQKYERPERKQEQPQKRTLKISIPRWFSKKMAEYDIERELWGSGGIKGLDLPVYPFCSFAFCNEMNEFYVLGGFNNKVDKKSAFCTRALKIKEEYINPFESIYTTQQLTPMRKQRGCFPTAIIITKRYKLDQQGHVVTEDDIFMMDEDEKLTLKEIFEGQIYAIGGKKREDKVLKHCERYDLIKQQWTQIASLNNKRMNASACAFSLEEGVFVFGGEEEDGIMLSSIEQYIPSENKWILLELALPSPITFQVPYKVSKRKILLFGGIKFEELRDGSLIRVKSDDVISFNVQLGMIRHMKDLKLSRPIFSLYPCFQFQDINIGNLMRSSYVNTSRPNTQAQQQERNPSRGNSAAIPQILMNKKDEKNEVCVIFICEEGNDKNPSLETFSIKTFLPGGENY